MNPDDAFERCLGLLHEAALEDTRWPAASALIDEACGAGGNALTVGEASGGEHRIHFSRLLYRGESRQDVAREYFGVHYPEDAGMRRLMDRPEGRPVHLPELWSEDERRTSPVYNEGWCQSAFKVDPESACNIDPSGGWMEVVPVVHRGDPRGFA